MNKKTIWIAVAIIIILIIIGVTKNGKNRTSEETIKIGGIFALTGVGTGTGEEELKGAQLAIKEINKSGGINGVDIELIAEDVSIDKLKNAGNVAHKLIDIDKVVAIVGPQWDEPALAILPIINEAMVPTVGVDITDTVETSDNGKYLFSTWYDNRVGIDELLKFAQGKGWKNVVIIRPLNAGFWKFASDEFLNNASKFGITIVDDIDLGNPLTTDFRTHFAKTKSKTFDAIFTVTADPMQCSLDLPHISNTSKPKTTFLYMFRRILVLNSTIQHRHS